MTREGNGKKTHFQVRLHSPVHRLGFERIMWRRHSLTHSALFFQIFTVWPNSLLPYGRHFFFTFYFIYLGHTGSSLLCEAFSSCRAWEFLFVAVQGLLTSVDSVVAEHRPLIHRLKYLQLASSVVAWLLHVCGIFPDQGSNR